MNNPAVTPTDSLDLVFNEVKEELAGQDARLTTLDGKSNFGLASASLLTAGLVSFQKAVPVTDANRLLQLIYWTLVVAALITYVIVVFTAYKAYRILPFKSVPDPNLLVQAHLNRPERETKQEIIAASVRTFNHNEGLLKGKTQWTNAVITSLLVEAGLLLAITVVQLMYGQGGTANG